MNRVSLRAGVRTLSTKLIPNARLGVDPLQVAMKSTTVPSSEMMKSIQAMQMHSTKTKGKFLTKRSIGCLSQF